MCSPFKTITYVPTAATLFLRPLDVVPHAPRKSPPPLLSGRIPRRRTRHRLLTLDPKPRPR